MNLGSRVIIRSKGEMFSYTDVCFKILKHILQ